MNKQDSADSRTQVMSFAALTPASMHTLILGTMPGVASLQANQYYAHPRNAFWPILYAIINNQTPDFNVNSDCTYKEKCKHLLAHGYGLWDVLARCNRPGSLDSAIVRHSEEANDIGALIDSQPSLHTIACNGRTAEKLFKRHVSMDPVKHALRVVSLPSSSPAYASMSLQQKFESWYQTLVVDAH
jgi:hypoxanthine-DNA glycosylase